MSIRLDEQLEAELRTAADDRLVGFSLLCNRLLRDGLERLVPVAELLRSDQD